MNNLVSPAGSLFKLENGSLQIHMVYVDIRHEYDILRIKAKNLSKDENAAKFKKMYIHVSRRWKNV